MLTHKIQLGNWSNLCSHLRPGAVICKLRLHSTGARVLIHDLKDPSTLFMLNQTLQKQTVPCEQRDSICIKKGFFFLLYCIYIYISFSKLLNFISESTTQTNSQQFHFATFSTFSHFVLLQCKSVYNIEMAPSTFTHKCGSKRKNHQCGLGLCSTEAEYQDFALPKRKKIKV